ncbi:MAG: acyl-CoA dehydrogenase [Gammaproteobacteria bacterium]|nr:acyl-CoA dehydrogenase [Gammaproteobacteria bacterium]
MSTEYSPPLREQLFLLEHLNRWDELFSLAIFRHADAEVAKDVLTAGAEFARGVLAPLNAAGDEHGCRLENGRVVTAPGFKAAWSEFAAGGWPGLDMPQKFGGQDLPLSVQVAFAEMVNGACVSFGMMPIMLRAGGRLLLDHAEPALVERIVPRLVSGEWGATICITEPQAGSDVGRLRTTAVPRADGSYGLSGTKIFISYGDHDLTDQVIHFVLARPPGAPAGTQGISLFAVPARRFDDGSNNGVSVSRLEKKMGLKASPTCVFNLDQAVGWRIGPEFEGLRCMFTMVNLMRLEVAIQGVALAQAATDRAWAYAGERLQGGRPDQAPTPIRAHADVQRMLMIMQARTRAMRALVFQTAHWLDLARAAPAEEQRLRARHMAEILLPVCKTCGAETAFEVASLAVQVFGGHGYIRDAGVEQYVRDSRVASIYEGTSGIQALDLLTRKVLKDDAARFRRLLETMRADVQWHRATPALATLASALEDAIASVERCTTELRGRAATQPRAVEWAATDYLQLIGLVAGAWMWLRMAAASGSGSAEDRERRRLAGFYMQWLLPQAAVHQARIALGGACELAEFD